MTPVDLNRLELDGQRTHIVRPPVPWSMLPASSECGREASDLKSTMTLDEAKQLREKLGQQRFAIVICMTCARTAGSWPTFEQDPLQRLGRERNLYQKGGEQVRNELFALAELAARHRDEYEGLVAEIGGVTRLKPKRGIPRVVGQW